MVPVGLVPEPKKETDWQTPIEAFEAGLVIVAVGGWSVGVAESWTNCATEGTPEEFRMKSR